MNASGFFISAVAGRYSSWRLPVAALVMILLHGPGAPANAACVSPQYGSTECAGNPVTFPSGGAVYIGAVNAATYRLNVFNLTGNIQPQPGIVGAAVTSEIPGQPAAAPGVSRV